MEEYGRVVHAEEFYVHRMLNCRGIRAVNEGNPYDDLIFNWSIEDEYFSRPEDFNHDLHNELYVDVE